MIFEMKIREERENAQIEQLIETSRKYNAADRDIIKDLMESFGFAEEDALDELEKYDEKEQEK